MIGEGLYRRLSSGPLWGGTMSLITGTWLGGDKQGEGCHVPAHGLIKQAPWSVVPADVKRHARLNVIWHLLSQFAYKTMKPEKIKLPERQKRSGYVRARSTVRRIRILARPLGSRSRDNLTPKARSRASASRNSAASFSTRRRGCRISCWSSSSPWWVTSKPTTTFGCTAEPPTGRRAKNAEIRRDGHVPCVAAGNAEPVVIALLRAAPGSSWD